MVVRYVSFLIECLPGRVDGSEMARKGDEKRGVLTRDALDEVSVVVLFLLFRVAWAVVVVWVGVVEGRMDVLFALLALCCGWGRGRDVVLDMVEESDGGSDVLVVGGEEMEASEEVLGAGEVRWGLGRCCGRTSEWDGRGENEETDGAGVDRGRAGAAERDRRERWGRGRRRCPWQRRRVGRRRRGRRRRWLSCATP